MEKEEKWLLGIMILSAVSIIALVIGGFTEVKKERQKDRLEERKVEALETIAARFEDLYELTKNDLK